MIRRLAVLVALAGVLGVVNREVRKKEETIASGRRVYLALRPVDPRSLLQGDYMALRYAMNDVIDAHEDWPKDGAIVVRDAPGAGAEFVRRDDGGALGPGELRLRYRTRGGEPQVGSDAYHFEEGTAKRYEAARYAELRVDVAGESVLVGLADAAFAPLGSGFGGDPWLLPDARPGAPDGPPTWLGEWMRAPSAPPVEAPADPEPRPPTR
ncbi:MAG: GDYXXLXY domain-containing protein [Myxococcota bacterium]